MKVLIYAPYFPPYNAIGSIRSGNLVRFLVGQGVDVRVISASHEELDKSQPEAASREYVTHLTWYDSNPQHQLQNRTSFNFRNNIETFPRLFRLLRKIFRSVLYWPDRHQFWVKPALQESEKLLEIWKPDLIFASALPASALIAAQKTALKHNIKWIADFRDLWAHNAFNETWWLRDKVNCFWEKRILASASVVVTVSEDLASVLRQRHGREVQVIMNGFEKRNHSEPRKLKPPPIIIRHMGSLYGDKRDPSPLFRALKELGTDRNKFRVEFYGSDAGRINKLAESFGLLDIVRGYQKVSFQESLRLQATADLLLLVMWNDRKERGIFTGKFFEYVSTDNPILLLGSPTSQLGRCISENELGFAALSTNDIVLILSELLDEVQSGKGLSLGASAKREQFSSNEAFKKLFETMKLINYE